MLNTIRAGRLRLCAAMLLATMLVHAGCGTLLYPERRGQTAGRIDPGVAILNGLGLLLFLVPGIIAFIVDFSTGAIYLPPEETDAAGVTIHLNPNEMTAERIAEAIREHTGREITLTDEDVRIIRVDGGRRIEELLRIAREEVDAAMAR